MNTIAKFEKVSFEQFKKDWENTVPDYKSGFVFKNIALNKHPELTSEGKDTDLLKSVYDNIKIPTRGTIGSAGYDIAMPFWICLVFGQSKTIPTGLRCIINDGWFLDINPRSGQGFKSGIRLANTRGIIDSDYSNADNEGHIMIKLVNSDMAFEGNTFTVNANKAFCQGIFLPYGITSDDASNGIRNGGFGSTDNISKNI